MQKIGATHPDAIMVGGLICENGGQLIKDKVAVLGTNTGKVKLLLPDGFTTQSTIDEAGGGKAPRACTRRSPASRRPADRVRARRSCPTSQTTYHPDALDPYTPYAAAAAQVLLNAIAASDGTPGERRLAPVRRDRSPTACSATSPSTTNGDTNQGSMTIDVAKGGKLVTYKVLTPPANLVETFH